ncbi:MAG: AAA family ATPase [Planctomycetota bacterium]|nr:AAA family ATPase [Planctomycetota bacterium]MDA1165325.1 AAA family ATPase [Planctomycetota bacterium]
MSTTNVIEILRERILCHFPLLFLTTWEEDRWESELATLALDIERGLVLWTATDGAAPPLDTTNRSDRNPAEFLQQIADYPRDHVFLLKDFHPFLKDSFVVRRLRDVIPTLTEQNKTILLMGPDGTVPIELQRDSVSLELPLPGLDELREELRELLIQRQHNGEPNIRLTDQQEEKLLKTVMGLTTKQVRQSMARALLGRSKIDNDVYALLISEKKHMVQGSDLLEFQELSEGAQDIGGLDALKSWVRTRSEAFSEKARARGIPAPKGVLLLGVQGCGKSLTSRAIAQMLAFPLVRLDVSTLLSGGLGQSEKNLRDVLNLMEMISPAVLWMDEVEKGFAGVSEGAGSDSTMIRLMGRFLTWMQEKKAPVFVVATANSVTGLPPEMLRRGRFDELFFVDLPNYHERKAILEIHLKKQNLKSASFDMGVLADKTEGYSGAEIEQAVQTAVVENYNRGGSLEAADLEEAIDDTVPLSVTMEEKIFELREWARTRCRAATPDSRVLQMLEEEHREKTGQDDGNALSLFEEDAADASEEQFNWRTMLAEGRVRSGLLEFVSEKNQVTLAELQEAVGEHVEVNGEFGLALRADPHVVIWHGMSAEIAAPLAKLISERKLYLHPVSSLRYGDSAAKVTLPKLVALTDDRQSRAMWLPATISAIAPEDVDERLVRVARMKLQR